MLRLEEVRQKRNLLAAEVDLRMRALIGTQHVIDESDLQVLMPASRRSLPAAWRKTATGEAMPDVVRAVRRSSEGR